MPKAKPVSLHPLSFDEAMKALINVQSQPTKKLPLARKETKKKH